MKWIKLPDQKPTKNGLYAIKISDPGFPSSIFFSGSDPSLKIQWGYWGKLQGSLKNVTETEYIYHAVTDFYDLQDSTIIKNVIEWMELPE
ncbi:MAG: hypothetical protein V4509_01780 [Patescibacteria group bacterium]